ncbi:unnamed protein product [Spirodela intermedia]|uniref:Uncharacterized protein n=1 Tax=Spirodela intermedia TaxID=51605 RepID=A0A7I8KWU2_SPIIN|nr:unnamed protein product [Spirodela intermedia]
MEATPATCCSRLLGGEGSVAASGRRRALSLSTACRKFRETADARPRARRAGSAVVLAASSSPSFDLSPPPIDYDGDDLQFGPSPSGAEDLPDTAIGSFADDNTALNAAYDGVAVIDLTHFGRIRVSGEDRVQFLHNQSTANFQSLSEGQGCDTVLVTPTARTIDIPHAWVMKNAIMLLVSPTTCKTIVDMLSRYIFFSDKVEINDITGKTCFFALMGPKSFQVMEALKLHDIIGKPYGTHHHYRVNDMPVTVGVGSLLSKEGFSLLMSPESAEPIWRTLLRHGAVPMGNSAWERLRILKGRPAPGKELTNDYNILEAGLWMTISLDKGCYKGQETVSRLITYDGVKQSLRGLRLAGPAEPGSPITVDGEKVGVLTSYAMGRDAGEHVGLGYIKRKAAASAGLQVTVGDVQGTVVDAPFLCYSLQT